jgi:hypothetical protein
MDLPDREELKRLYDDLANEVLIDIAQNEYGEYEKPAEEAALSVLKKRGVAIPAPDGPQPGSDLSSCSCCADGRPAAGPQQGGKELTGPVVEIPRFTAEETAEVERIFLENGIDYSRQAVKVQSCSSCASEYVYHVREDAFHRAVRLLKDYYHEMADAASASTFSGQCPACGTEVSVVKECTECGLALTVDLSGTLENHQFFQFLKQCDL